MSQEVIIVEKVEPGVSGTLEIIEQNNLSENPAAIYLASLRPTGRRAMKVLAEFSSVKV